MISSSLGGPAWSFLERKLLGSCSEGNTRSPAKEDTLSTPRTIQGAWTQVTHKPMYVPRCMLTEAREAPDRPRGGITYDLLQQCWVWSTGGRRRCLETRRSALSRPSCAPPLLNSSTSCTVNNGNPNARTRALTPRVNACGGVLTVKSACSSAAVVTSNKVRTEQTITENSVRRLIQRLRSIGTASSRTRKIRER